MPCNVGKMTGGVKEVKQLQLVLLGVSELPQVDTQDFSANRRSQMSDFLCGAEEIFLRGISGYAAVCHLNLS